MWYWLRRSTHNSFVLWLYLAGLMSFFHLVMFFVLFFIYCDSITHLVFSVRPEHVKGRNSLRRPIEFRVAVETIKKSPPQKTGVIASPKKEIPLKQAQKQVTVAQPKKKEEPVHKKEVIAQKEKKPAPTVPSPVPVAPKVAATPVVPQPVVPEEHLDLQIMADQEMKGLEQYGALYEEIVACWSPPPGIPSDCSCTITIAIDREGKMTQMAIDASSGILMYDLAAQAAIGELQFPHMARGKSITITFTV